MKKGQNPNHPKKDSVIKVQPIIKPKDINSIKKLLSDKPRDLAIFVLGINTNLRASDILNLKVGQVKYIEPGEELEIKEQKTGKIRLITLNKSVVNAIQSWINSKPCTDDDYLFTGQRGRLTVSYLNALVKKWTSAINLKENYGSHSLRKTFGYQQRVRFGTSIPELMVMFNHSTQKQTLEYLCVQAEEIRSAYMNEI